MAMPVLSSGQDKPGPRLAGDPATFASAATPCNSADSAAPAAPSQQLVQSQHAVERELRSRGSRRRDGSQQRALLYFQLAGHEQPCGPIPLGALSKASQTVIGPPKLLLQRCITHGSHLRCTAQSRSRFSNF